MKLVFWSFVGLCSAIGAIIAVVVVQNTDMFAFIHGTDALINSFVTVVFFERNLTSRLNETKAVWSLGYCMGKKVQSPFKYGSFQDF